MNYYLVEKRESFVGYDFSIMPLFAPALSYEIVYGRLMKFLSSNRESKVRSFVIYFGSCPFERITVLRDRIIRSKSCADARKKSEIDADFFYEARSRRAPSVVHSVISNDWYNAGHVEEGLPSTFRRRIQTKKSKRNCKKRPM